MEAFSKQFEHFLFAFLECFEKSLNFQNFKFFVSQNVRNFTNFILLVNKNAIKYLGGPFFGDKTNIFENLMYYEFRFGIIGFGSVNDTEISVSVISVFTRFGRPLIIADMEYVYLLIHFQKCHS